MNTVRAAHAFDRLSISEHILVTAEPSATRT